MRKIIRWTQEEFEAIKSYYPKEGATGLQKMFPYRSIHSFVDMAYRLNVKWDRPIPKRTFCLNCGKETFQSYGKGRKRKYKSKSKRCFKCSCIARRKPNQIKLTKKYKSGWTKEELNFLEINYPKLSTKQLASNLNRKENSISHKANRLRLKKPRQYFVNKGMIGSFVKNNPMKNKEIRKMVSNIKRQRYKDGKIKLSGIALKSKMGLTRKENHPNWLGGKSFEPYDSRWDNKFKNFVRKRDNQVCMLCGTHREKLKTSLHVHHVNYNKKLSIPENCISLCNCCHVKTNYNRKQWTSFFQSLLSDRYSYDYSKQQEVKLNIA